MPLVFVDAADYEKISQGDQLSIALADVREKATATLNNATTGAVIAVTTPLFQEEIEIIRGGGRLNWIKAREAAK